MQAIVETLFDAAYLSTVVTLRGTGGVSMRLLNEEEHFLSGTKKRLRVNSEALKIRLGCRRARHSSA